MNFLTIKTAVQKQLNIMQQGTLLLTDTNPDTLWDLYLNSFPEGTNNIFRVRREHDCSADRSFIRNIGGVVSEVNGELVSIWDITVDEPAYQIVADTMSAYVKAQAIKTRYVHYQNNVGIDKAYEQMEDRVHTWENFFIELDNKHVVKKDTIAQLQGEVDTNKTVLARSLNEISEEAVDTVLELIAQNSIYRGAEFKSTVDTIKKMKKELASSKNPEYYLVTKAIEMRGASSLRNTVIGTLLVDLSEGVDLTVAVKKFEDKTAPTNYKRPTALITQSMIKDAEKTVTELGIEPSLHRRYAVLSDITINNVLWADRSVKESLGVFGELKKDVGVKLQNLDKVESVSLDDFINNILPTAKGVQLYVENKHANNFVSLVAPVYPNSKNILKWGNNFSWSYNGELADSDLRKAVASKGGRVDGVFRFSHMWNYDKRNASLMDLHVFFPANRRNTASNVCNNEYGNKCRVGWNNRNDYSTGCVQDVDYTDVAPVGYIPVENITFPSVNRMPEGTYVCQIHNWSLRQPTQGGFKAEIEVGGVVYQYEYDKPLKNKEWVTVAEVTLKNGVFSVKSHLPVSDAVSKEIYGVNTCNFHKVDAIMFSPNHWDGEQTGNKHVFLMLEGCKNDEQTRGFYNEFLNSSLDKHRKVFEVLGSKLKTPKSDSQLSGVGFSTTKRDEFIVKVDGAFSRIIKVKV